MGKKMKVSVTVDGLEPKTGRLIMKDGSPRSPGIDPKTGKYSTAQMMFDELYGGDPSEPLFD